MKLKKGPIKKGLAYNICSFLSPLPIRPIDLIQLVAYTTFSDPIRVRGHQAPLGAPGDREQFPSIFLGSYLKVRLV